MDTLYICKKCKKPDPKQVTGKAQKGAKLIGVLAAEKNLNFKVVPCKCLGKCKQGPNGVAMPGRVHVHHLSLKKIKQIAAAKEQA